MRDFRKDKVIYDNLSYHISYIAFMKVTAIIDDELISETIALTGAKTITTALKTALSDFIKRKKLAELNKKLINEPLEFYKTAEEIRNTNRRK